MSELKQCPFCGSDAVVFDAFYTTPKGGVDKVEYWCGCSECNVETAIDHSSNGSREGAIYIWNQRAETETEKRLTAIATKHATLNDERYELLEKQKSDIEKMLDQLFKHENVDAWLVCKMNDMLDDVNRQLDKSRIEAEEGL